MVKTSAPPPVDVPQRFETAKSTLLIDRYMTYVITVGGIGVIVAVLGIFVFILSQILPLFQGATVTPQRNVQLPQGSYVFIGSDEWTEYPFALAQDGSLVFVDLVGKRGVRLVDPGFDGDVTFTAFHYDQQQQNLVYATDDGRFAVVPLNYEANFTGGTRVVEAQPQAGQPPEFAETFQHYRVRALGCGGQK